MNKESKISEGNEHIKKAEKCLQTSFFKWKPEYDTAADEYGKAATAFKIAKSHNETIHCYMKASELLAKTGSFFHSAKALESAALIHKECKNFEPILALFIKAGYLYMENGTPDTASISFERGAKILERVEPLQAIELYQKAFSASEMEDKLRHAAEMIGKAARIYMRLEKYSDATRELRRELDLLSEVNHEGQVYKLVLPLVLLLLHQDDSVAAEIQFKASFRYSGFAASEEASNIQELLDAYEQGDEERVKQILNSPLFKYMENDFNKLARDLKVPEGLGVMGASGDNPTEDNTTSADQSESPTTTKDNEDKGEEEEDFGNGLM